MALRGKKKIQKMVNTDLSAIVSVINAFIRDPKTKHAFELQTH